MTEESRKVLVVVGSRGHPEPRKRVKMRECFDHALSMSVRNCLEDPAHFGQHYSLGKGPCAV